MVNSKSLIPSVALSIVIIVGIIPFLHTPHLHATDRGFQLPSVPVINDEEGSEFEPIVDPSLWDASENPILGAAAACRVLDIVHREQGSFYKAEYALDAKKTGNANVDQIFSKVKRWNGPQSVKGGGGVTIFCLVYTEGGDSAQKMKETWLGDCDDYLVVSRFPDPPTGIPKDHYYEVHVVLDTKPDSMFPRISQTLHMLAMSKASKFDYFVYMTDDSHVVVENLRMALNDPSVDSLHRLGAPLYMGHRMVTGDDAPFISNAFMIMNSQLMKLFRTILPDSRCYVTHQGGSEDLFLSKCLQAFRIFPLSIEDVFGQERLHVLDVPSASSGGGGGWYADYHRGFNPPKGYDAFSRSTFHFHYVAGRDQAGMKSKIAV